MVYKSRLCRGGTQLKDGEHTRPQILGQHTHEGILYKGKEVHFEQIKIRSFTEWVDECSSTQRHGRQEGNALSGQAKSSTGRSTCSLLRNTGLVTLMVTIREGGGLKWYSRPHGAQLQPRTMAPLEKEVQSTAIPP